MRLFLSALLLLAFAVLARAEGGKWPHEDAMRKACGADAERFCKGSPNIGTCLHEHWDELSQGCRDFKESMKKQWQSKQGQGKHGQKGGDDPAKRYCGGDLERFCSAAADPGACLHEHWNELSDGCRAFKEGMKTQWQAKPKDAETSGEAPAKKGKMLFKWSDPAKEAGGKQSAKPSPGVD
jgi:hypothetical protein